MVWPAVGLSSHALNHHFDFMASVLMNVKRSIQSTPDLVNVNIVNNPGLVN